MSGEAPRNSGRRPSLTAEAMSKDADGTTSSVMMKKYLVGERNLSVRSMTLRSEVEMWLMEQVPKLFGVEESEKLDVSVREEAQSEFLNSILFEKNDVAGDKIASAIETTFKKAGIKEDHYAGFATQLKEKIKAVREAFKQARKDSKEIPRTQADIPTLAEEEKKEG